MWILGLERWDNLVIPNRLIIRTPTLNRDRNLFRFRNWSFGGCRSLGGWCSFGGCRSFGGWCSFGGCRSLGGWCSGSGGAIVVTATRSSNK